MRLRDFGTVAGLWRVVRWLLHDTRRRPWRLPVNLPALAVLLPVLLMGWVARGPWSWVLRLAERIARHW